MTERREEHTPVAERVGEGHRFDRLLFLGSLQTWHRPTHTFGNEFLKVF
jgi:hypothetical protein